MEINLKEPKIKVINTLILTMRSKQLNLKFLSKSIQFKNKLKSLKNKKKKKKQKQWQIELS
jgi:hypothetical protein